MEMALVRAAKTSKAKKTVARKVVPGIWLRAMGTLMNTRPGPAAGSMPWLKMMGKSISEATRAIQVSRAEMVTEAPTTSSWRRR